MKRLFSICLIGYLLLQGCTPKPLPIDIAQAQRQIAISSSVIDAHTLLLTATYSLTGLTNLNDTNSGSAPQGITADLLLRDAFITISSDEGTDTLQKIYDGVYGAYKLQLLPYKLYLLRVKDNSNGNEISATTSFIPLTTIHEIKPTVTRNPEDTLVKMRISLQDDPATSDYFVMSYSKTNPSSDPGNIGGNTFSIANTDEEKKLELFSDADAANGKIIRDFDIFAGGKDTIYVHVGRVDKGYYEFLTAYKRTGGWLNQLTGEPVTLPTNIRNGLGYFNLYEAKRMTFFLKDY